MCIRDSHNPSLRSVRYAQTNLAVGHPSRSCFRFLKAIHPGGAKLAPEHLKYFHLDFVVKELDGGKVVNARHYSTRTDTEDRSLRCAAATRLPVQVGDSGPDGQFTYVEVGVNNGCRTAQGNTRRSGPECERGNQHSTTVTAQRQPLIRQTKWSSNVIVPIGKPTVILSFVDVASKSQMQLELTATPVK